jgi:hypothetical protein
MMKVIPLLGITGAGFEGTFDIEEPETKAYEIKESSKDSDLTGIHSVQFPDNALLCLNEEDMNEPLLLESDKKTRAIIQGYLIEFNNTRERIDQWILHQLRTSPGQVHALWRVIDDSFPYHAVWTTLAISMWSHDTLGRNQPYY